MSLTGTFSCDFVSTVPEDARVRSQDLPGPKQDAHLTVTRGRVYADILFGFWLLMDEPQLLVGHLVHRTPLARI